MLRVMVTSRQIRAARALLGWTQEMLADRALVAVNTVRAMEQDRPYPKPDTIEAVWRALEKAGVVFLADEQERPYPKSDTIEAVRRALEKAGVVFLADGAMGEGVRLAKPKPAKTR